MPRPFLLNVVVWGENYTRQLIDFTIPTLLANSNIPKLVKHRPCEFLFVTRPEDAELLKSSDSFMRLSAYLPVDFALINFESQPGSKYDLMTIGHKVVVQRGRESGAYGVFLMPEMLIADGSLFYLHKTVAAGARAVVAPVLRLVEEEVVHLRGRDKLCIQNRALVRLLFEHAHHEMTTFMVTSELFSACPGFVIWPLDGLDTWIIHGIHSQPVLVDLSNADPDLLGLTLDASNFVSAAVGDHETVDVVADSDKFVMCSLTSINDVPTPHSWVPPEPASVRDFMNSTPYVNELHRWYFTHPVVFHSGRVPEDLASRLEVSAGFVRQALG